MCFHSFDINQVKALLLKVQGAYLGVSIQRKMLRHVPADVHDPALQQIGVRRERVKANSLSIVAVLPAVRRTFWHTAVLRHDSVEEKTKSTPTFTKQLTSKNNFESDKPLSLRSSGNFEHQLGFAPFRPVT